MRIRLLMSLIVLIAVPCVWGQVGPDFDVINSDDPPSTMGLTSSMAEYSNLRLTNDPGESVNPRAVVDADFLYVVWEDTHDGNREIFWQKFSRGGSPVTSPMNLSNTGANSVKPAIGVDGSGNSYLVWQEGTLYGTVYGLVADGDGNIIVGPLALSSNLCLDPDIAVKADGTNWVVYHRRSASDQNVYARLSTANFTQTCVRGLNAGTLPSFDKKPAVTINTVNGEGYIGWQDMDTWWNDGIYINGLYPNCGTSFFRRQATGEYKNPDMGFSGVWPWMVAQLSGNIYNLYGNTSIYRINEVSGTAANPQVGDDPDYGYAVWQDSRNGDWEIYLSRAYGNTAFPDVRLTEDPASSANPDVATYNPVPGEWWVVWQDNRDGNWEIYLTGSVLEPQPANLVLEPTILVFEATQGGPLPEGQTFTVTNTGGGMLDWYVDEQISWLDLDVWEGPSNSQEITVSISSTGLFPDTYNEIMTVTSSNADNSPLTIEVEYVVQPTATADVSGFVHDGSTGSGLGGVLVAFVYDNVVRYSTTTAESTGQYGLSGISAGVYDVAYSKAGYVTVTQEKTIDPGWQILSTVVLSSGEIELVTPAKDKAYEVGSTIDIVWNYNPGSEITDIKLFYQTSELAPLIDMWGFGYKPVEQGSYSWTLPETPFEEITISIVGYNSSGGEVASVQAPSTIVTYVKNLMINHKGYTTFGWDEVPNAAYYQLDFTFDPTSTVSPYQYFSYGTDITTNYKIFTKEVIGTLPSASWSVGINAYNVSNELLGTPTQPMHLFHLETLPGFNDNPSDKPVLLVHGIWSTIKSNWLKKDHEDKLNDMLEDMHDQGFRFYGIEYPNIGGLEISAWGLSHVTKIITEQLEPVYSKIPILAHSMGGVVSRTYVEGFAKTPLGESVPYNDKVSHLITAGTPHQGAWLLGDEGMIRARVLLLMKLFPLVEELLVPGKDDDIIFSKSLGDLKPNSALINDLKNSDLITDIRYLFNRGCISLSLLYSSVDVSFGLWAMGNTVLLSQRSDGFVVWEDAVPPASAWSNGTYNRIRGQRSGHTQMVTTGQDNGGINVSLFVDFLNNNELDADQVPECGFEFTGELTTEVKRKQGSWKTMNLNEPLPNAYVQLIPKSAYDSGLVSSYVFKTSSDGSVTVPYIPEDDYVVVYSSPGYNTFITELTIDINNLEIINEVILEPDTSWSGLIAPSIIVDNNSQYTNDTTVSVIIGNSFATELKISAVDDLDSLSWQPIISVVDVELTNVLGPKIISAVFKDGDGNISEEVFAVILYDTLLNCQLTVNSTPPGAGISINGTGSGFQTPYTFTNLPIDTFTVSISLSGYENEELYHTIGLESGQSGTLDINLIANTAPSSTSMVLPDYFCGDSVQLVWNTSSDPENDLLFYEIYVSTDTSTANSPVQSSLSDTTSYLSAGNFTVGDNFLGVVVVDAFNNKSDITWNKVYYRYVCDCCGLHTAGLTGNVDCEGIIDIGDVTVMIQNLFITLNDPCCFQAADLDRSGIIDIGDLTMLIASLFITLNQLPGCP